MGEVYRARDVRLGRDVAVKVLREHLALSAQDRARFLSEAKAVSNLNHPHICILHDIGQSNDTDYIVMELVEGETLERRLSRGPLPIEEALKIGSQIADALDRAHRAGIIHRDLKPGNVMLSKGGAKLMDFGLARWTTGVNPPSGNTTDATRSLAPEPSGSPDDFAGTVHYMSPEQLERGVADSRSDIWALGCVLYEMVARRRPFDGPSRLKVVAAILSGESPDVKSLAPSVPAALEKLILGCLCKDPDERIQSAHDVCLQLHWILEAASGAGPREPHTDWRSRAVLWIAAILGTAVLGAAILLGRPSEPSPRLMFQLPPPKSVTAPNIYYVSPDGRRFVTDWTDANNVPSLWVRRADSVTLARLPGTEGASWPFWSPDGEHVAYEQSGALWTMWANGGPAVRVCDGVRGMGSWGKNGTILLASKEDGPIQMVNSSGGHPTSVTHLDKGRKETKHFWPHFLPDGVHFLFLAKVTGEDEFLLCAASIRGGRTRIVGRTQSRVEFASGRILYVRGGTLFARPFDVRSLKFTGDPSAIVENVEYFPNIGYARFSSSPATLVYRASGVIPNAHLLWVDRQGFTTKEVAGRGLYLSPAVSPDGTELSAVVAVDSTTYTRDIWTWDLSRTLGARTTFTNSYMGCNVWAADGRHILYSSRDSLRLVSTERPDIDTVLTPLDGCPYSWTRDGRWIAFTRWGERDQDVYAISLGDRGREVPIAKTPQAEVDPALTPDGRFVAYAGAESGQLEIFVQAFPSGQPRWRVSTSGGQEPFWRQDGRELFYLSPQRELMAVAVGPGLKPQFGTPHKLFDAPVVLRVASRNSYAPAPDGQHFLIVAAEREWTGASTVVVNWSSGLEP